MNAIRFPQPTTARERPAATPTGATTALPAPIRHHHRERDFGVGYGNSSGYASHRRYSSAWATAHFKFA